MVEKKKKQHGSTHFLPLFPFIAAGHDRPQYLQPPFQHFFQKKQTRASIPQTHNYRSVQMSHCSP